MMTKLIVALDGEPGLEARAMIDALAKAGVRWFKVGVPMVCSPEGLWTAAFARLRDAQIMLDLKLYDTRDTVRRAVDAAVNLGAAMLTVHADCVPHVAKEDRLRIIAVRRLTDGTAGDTPVAWETEASGFVCPFSHVAALRRLTDKIIITPGIRPAEADPHNHVSRATPAQAAEAGADYIVVGRPIIAAPDPVEAAKHILRELHASVPPLSS
jgi:orotidine-5'-phosphate decarboxylase